MSRAQFAAICLISATLSAAAAGEPGLLPVAPSAALPATTEPNSDERERTVDHLLKAADHLEAAGLLEEAAKLRNDARQRTVYENVLSRKESELECLQEEVDRLRALTGQVQTVLIEIVALEVDRRKLGLKARDFDKLIGLTPSGSHESAPVPREIPRASRNTSAEMSGIAETNPARLALFKIAEANPARLPLFKELRDKGAIKVLAEPTVVTTSRRPASFLTGGEIPVRVKSASGEVAVRNVRFGTDLEVVAVVLPSQRIRLRTSFELREVRKNEVDDDGSAHPGINTRRLNTEVEMQLGQTLTVGRLILQRPDAGEAKGARAAAQGSVAPVANGETPAELIETIVFITPRLAYPAAPPRPIEAVPAGAEDDVLQPIVPAVFDPADWNALGPPMPVLKRRTVRD
ncbi:MAG: hypothetical protein ACM3U2_18670 [Deltaproteobacteria bacterium]